MIELLKMSKAECIKHLNLQGRLTKKAFKIKYNLADIDFEGEVYFQNKKVYSLILQSANKNMQALTILKAYFLTKNLSLEKDNTNHEYNHYFLEFANEELLIRLDYDMETIRLYCFNKSNQSEPHYDIKQTALLWLIYLSGGFVWGLTMFLLMGAGNFNLKSFAIWMLGGLIFGILFGICFEGLGWFSNKLIKSQFIDKKNYRYLYQQIVDYELGQCYEGRFHILENNKAKVYPALIHFEEKFVGVYYLKKRRIMIRKTFYDDFEAALPYHNLCYNDANKRFVFTCNDIENTALLCEKIKNKLGYYSDDYLCFKQAINTIIQEYDPASLYSLQDYDFEYETEIIARGLFLNKTMSKAEVELLVLNAFDYDMLFSHDLANLIEDYLSSDFNALNIR